MNAERPSPTQQIVGRFAPSPTGPLHFGSLVAALGSFLDARSRGGRWLVRIEDLDRPRCVPGAAEQILRSLERHGLEWDGALLYQSQREPFYQERLSQLAESGALYGCRCSRKTIAEQARVGAEGPIYPGSCRGRHWDAPGTRAVRVRTDDQPIAFQDRLQGWQTQRLESEVGDFIVRRADGLFAYQLAVVVDDAEQGVTEIVRGADLLTSTHRQRYLQSLLELPQPGYLHLPLVLGADGNKLSKQSHAAPIEDARAAENLLRALDFLGQLDTRAVNADLPLVEDVTTILEWGIAHWRYRAIPNRSESIPTADKDRRCS